MMAWKCSAQGQGVLVAADEKIEWLLPWWWQRYSNCNHLPVVFVDLGMSHFGLTFCAEKGQIIALEQEIAPDPLNQIPKEWGLLFGESLEIKRQSWFKKPFALLSTPFEKTLWLDLDCEVLRPLDQLFDLSGEIYLAQETENAISRERALQTIGKNEVLYNSGVILYSHGCRLIEKWAEAHLIGKGNFWSDQHSLSRLIHTHEFIVESLSENYNWRMSQGLNFQAAIVHWVGSWGKEYIRRHGGIAEELKQLPESFF